MNAAPPRSFTRLAIAIMIAAVVISASILSYSSFEAAVTRTASATNSTVTKTSTETATTTISSGVTLENTPVLYTSSISPQGLQLRVTLNSSNIQSHGEVAAQIELVNTLNRNVSLTFEANQNISAWNEDFFCGENPSRSLVGFALFSGHFSAENVSTAGSPLQLAAPVAIPCPISLGLNDSTFLPNSDRTISFSYYSQTQEPSYRVTAEVNATTGYCLDSACGTSSGLLGYWNPGFGYTANTTFTSHDFNYFPAGEYTIVAADDWIQTVYAHFQVNLAGSYTTTTNPANNLQLQFSGRFGPSTDGDLVSVSVETAMPSLPRTR